MGGVNVTVLKLMSYYMVVFTILFIIGITAFSIVKGIVAVQLLFPRFLFLSKSRNH